MNNFNVILCSLACLLPYLVVGSSKMPNFIAQDDLSDGQHEIRIHYNGITAKQSSVGPEQGSASGLVLRQVHHHHRLLTLVYVGQAAENLSVDGLSLRDCRVTDDMQYVKEFLDTFDTDVDNAMDTPSGTWSGPLHNVTFVHLDDEIELPKYLRPIVHFRKLRAQCKTHLRAVRRAVRAERRSEKSHRSHHHTEDSHSRRRRWILNEYFILPGTKWCGNDDLASSFKELDGHVRPDSCCRKHDNCPININAMQRKFGAFNSNPTTISHCICDERFKACLKLAKTGVADLVGDIFFNKMKTKCFDLVKKKVCIKRSGWLGFGACIRHSYRRIAVLRDNVTYDY